MASREGVSVSVLQEAAASPFRHHPRPASAGLACEGREGRRVRRVRDGCLLPVAAGRRCLAAVRTLSQLAHAPQPALPTSRRRQGAAGHRQEAAVLLRVSPRSAPAAAPPDETARHQVAAALRQGAVVRHQGGPVRLPDALTHQVRLAAAAVPMPVRAAGGWQPCSASSAPSDPECQRSRQPSGGNALRLQVRLLLLLLPAVAAAAVGPVPTPAHPVAAAAGSRPR